MIGIFDSNCVGAFINFVFSGVTLDTLLLKIRKEEKISG
jgi:hypothetical protein